MPILYDSSVYIGALRKGGDLAVALQRWARETPLWLSAVVVEELYAGGSRGERRIVEKMERDFDRTGRVLVPNLNDWTTAGRILAAIAEAHGYEAIGRARMTNDALIAASAVRSGT